MPRYNYRIKSRRGVMCYSHPNGDVSVTLSNAEFSRRCLERRERREREEREKLEKRDAEI